MAKFTISVAGKQHIVSVSRHNGTIEVLVDGKGFSFPFGAKKKDKHQHTPSSVSPVSTKKEEASSSERPLVAPMPGTIAKVYLKQGAHYKAGSAAFVLLAMKMQNEVMLHEAATIKSIEVKEGQTVDKNTVLCWYTVG